jgi:hypothetical protein
MENQTSQNQTTSTPPLQPVVPQVPPVELPKPEKNNLVVILLSVLLIIALFINSYLFLRVQSLTKQLAQVQVEIQATPIPSPISTSTPDVTASWKTYVALKTEFTKGFTLYYPPTWKLEITQTSIKLSRGPVWFEIRQGAGSVGACLFDDDKNNSNAPQFASIFPAYSEIKKNNQITWRFATVENPKSWDDTFLLCEKKAGDPFYLQETSIGYVPFRVPQTDTTFLTEVLEILKKIEITY